VVEEVEGKEEGGVAMVEDAEVENVVEQMGI